jgi:hypothetical protein
MSMWRVVERLQLGMAGDGLVRGFLHGAARTVEFVNAFSLVGGVSMSKKQTGQNLNLTLSLAYIKDCGIWSAFLSSPEKPSQACSISHTSHHHFTILVR